MGQDFLGVFESLLHFGVVMLEGNSDADAGDLGLLISVSDHFRLGTQLDLSLVLEVDLDELVAQPKHDSMPSLHPLL